eukprot:Rmarinus@m.17995
MPTEEPFSASGKQYLEDNVFPVLQPALEELLKHVEQRAKSQAQGAFTEDATPQDLSAGKHSQDFKPLQWLGSYLLRHNPNAAGRTDATEAAHTGEAGAAAAALASATGGSTADPSSQEPLPAENSGGSVGNGTANATEPVAPAPDTVPS